MNKQIYEEATHWLIQHREGELSPKDKKRFDSWLRESPQHVRAYLEMSSIWEDVPALDAEWNLSADQLIARARAEGNVYPLADGARDTGVAEQLQQAPPARGQTGALRPTRAKLVALAATVLIAILGGTLWYGLDRQTYGTDIGEQRSLVLADGSTIELNSRSRVRIRYRATQRDVDLLEGQALFRVAHEAARPFVVHSGATEVVAVGTQFDVYRKRAFTVVTVVDGKVAVLSGSTPAGAPQAIPAPLEKSNSGSRDPIFLAAGEQLTIPVGKPARAANPAMADTPQAANVAAATAWTQHTLVFESSPLADVAEEFNRYNRRKLVITDPEIASLRISGMFSSADPGLFLKFLHAQPELNVQEMPLEIRIGKR